MLENQCAHPQETCLRMRSMTLHDRPIIVVGSCVIDLTVYTDRFPLIGETLVASDIQTQVGGKASNQAIGMRRLGADPWLIARVGQDHWGDLAQSLWSRQEIHTEYVVSDPSAATGIGVVTVAKGGENWNITALNANQQLSPDDIQAAKPVFERAKVVSIHLNAPIDTILQALTLGREHAVTTVLNASPYEQLPDTIFPLVDCLVVNQVEAVQFTGVEVQDDQTAFKAVRALRDRGANTVIVSLGSAGLIVNSPKIEHQLESFPVTAVDTVGAGDAFIAGLSVTLAGDKSILEAAHFANAVAALSVTRRGTWESMPHREEVEHFVGKL